MKFWADAQLPPSLAPWLQRTFGVEATSLKSLGLDGATDREIFHAATTASIVIISKDSEFVDLISRLGTPPQLIWVTCGNVTNRHLRKLFAATFEVAQLQISKGESIVENSDP